MFFYEFCCPITGSHFFHLSQVVVFKPHFIFTVTHYFGGKIGPFHQSFCSKRGWVETTYPKNPWTLQWKGLNLAGVRVLKLATFEGVGILRVVRYRCCLDFDSTRRFFRNESRESTAGWPCLNLQDTTWWIRTEIFRSRDLVVVLRTEMQDALLWCIYRHIPSCELTYPINIAFEDDFSFSKVRYVSSQEGNLHYIY